MKCFFFLAAFAASVNGLVGRTEPACCFHLNVSGEVTGPLGQLVDGQSRVGDNSLPQSQFCINSTGVITDHTGKGCIITTETTQFQCDEGKAGTPGFSISSSGQLQFRGSDYFIACETGQNGGMNIYTTNSTSVTRCKAVYLNADSCISSGSVPVVGIPPAPGANATGGIGGGAAGPGGSVSVSVSVSTVVSTVTASNCVCSTTAAPGTPGSAAPSVSSQISSAPGGTAPAVVPVAHTSVSSGTTAAPTSGGGAPPSSGISHTSTVPVTPVPGQPPSAASSTHPSTSCPSSLSASTSSAHPSSACPSCTQSAPSSSASSSASSACPSCQSASSSSAHPSSTFASSVTVPVNSTRVSSVPVTTSPSSVRPSSTIHANTTSTIATSTSASATSCPTNLSGEFQFPHLIVRIDSAKPDTTHGSGLNGTINSTVSTTFNFDIPSSYSGKTCSLIFLFPKKEDLQTTSYSFTGDGKIAIGKLSQTVSSSTTYNNVPSVSQGLGTITISPGNSYLVSTFSCPAGQAVAYEMKNAGSTDLEFFEDWNPSPLGLFITAC